MNELQMSAQGYDVEQCAMSGYPVVLLKTNGDTLRHDDDRHIKVSDLIRAGMYREQAVKACYEITELFDSIKLKLRNVK